MAWEEWEQLKATAAQRRSTQMQLNQLPADQGSSDSGGGADADLRISKTPWTSASRVADELRTATTSGLTDLRPASVGTAAGTEGFACTAALKETRTTWEARLTAVRDECGRLHGTLAKTGRHFGEVDHQVKGRADGVRVGNTPAWAR
ncbi:amino acid ABC transporter permease [Streptomyces sp. NPDC006393]|uniref:amino acid ABC transporter permease n=1 Tax=Streptomyces sp. NPDC006393 TaxID=3156763 RepID=UPI0034022929